MKTLIALLLLASTAFAEHKEVKIRIINAYGPHSIPKAQVTRLANQVIEELRAETGQNLKFKRVEHRRNPFQRHHSICDFNSTSNFLDLWSDWLDARNYYSNDDDYMKTVLVVAPPILCGGKYWLMGWSRGCQWPSNSIAFATPKSNTGVSRIPQGYTALKHELSHSLGAPDFGCGASKAHLLMSTCALGYARIPWFFRFYVVRRY